MGSRPSGDWRGFADDPVVMDWSSLVVGGKKEMIKPRISLRNTYQAVKALGTLHSRPKDPQACIQYVLGQLGKFQFGEATTSDTFYALSVLQSLDGLEKIETESANLV